jgi:STE20-like kinase
VNTAREAAIWELEEKHLTEKTNLAKRQLKDLFSLKRLQMMTRHEKVVSSCTMYAFILFCTQF